jgi:hypothetical protein
LASRDTEFKQDFKRPSTFQTSKSLEAISALTYSQRKQ